MDIAEALESPGFWLLGVGSSIAVILGWIMSKRAGWEAMPFWQVIIVIIFCLAASAFFSTRE